jgi:DNA-binding NarL/FixJ family response regulator
MKLKILLADDNLTFLHSVRNVLGMLSQAQVVAEAHDGLQALELATLLQPDVVLLDIVMPGMTGLDAARAMQSWAKPPKIVFLSLHDNIFYRAAARDLGAVGLVGKANFMIELLPVITGLARELQETKTASLTGTA